MILRLESQDSGTLVVWQTFDRLIAGSNNPQAEMTTKLQSLLGHLALVFHRYTQQESGNEAVEIRINGLKLPTRDPFLKANTYRQPLEGQEIHHERGIVKITPHILPPVSHLTNEEIDLAGGKEGLRNSQGFYIYRNRRLVIWGTWFRLVPKDEFFKLSRVQVDIPNSFDELWALDIKKSAAYPPDIIRNRLKDLIPYFAGKSRKTVTYPGRKAVVHTKLPIWIRIEPSHGTFRYTLNSEHPLFESLASTLNKENLEKLKVLLSAIESSIPIEAVYADMCKDERGAETSDISEMTRIARALMSVTKLTIDDIFEMEPLNRYPQIHTNVRHELGI